MSTDGTKAALRQRLLESPVARWAVGAGLIGRGGAYLASNRLFRALDDFGWVVRSSGAAPLAGIGRQVVFNTVRTITSTGRNPVVESYWRDDECAALAASYSLNGGPHELLRDLIVLKRATADEKGVILLKYVRTFDAVVSMLDLERLMERYTFALEPCWSGYCDPSLLMFIHRGQPVVVQCFTEDDYRFVSALGAPLVPVRLGPADWVDADLFASQADDHKQHDIVMVQNWAVHKRHATLFAALSRMRDRHLRVLLIGFPNGGRTADDIRREAATFDLAHVALDILESLPAAEVARRVGQCKVFAFLSPKEGDNKALVEAMFANVATVVYAKSIGGATSRINPATGILSTDEELPERLGYMLDHYRSFSPRRWALEHTGSGNATRLLNDTITRAVTAAGGRWTHDIVEKTNAPNLAYKDPAVRARFAADYEFILGCRRGTARLGNGAQPNDRTRSGDGAQPRNAVA